MSCEPQSNWRFDPVTGAPLAGVSTAAVAPAATPTATATATATPADGGSNGTYVDMPTATVFAGPANGNDDTPIAIAIPQGQNSEYASTLDRGDGAFHPGEPHVHTMMRFDEFGRPVYDPEEDATCALIGCLFSCNPIIGCLTWYFNARAPVGSKRRFFGVMAGTIAMLTIVNMLLFPEQYHRWRAANTTPRAPHPAAAAASSNASAAAHGRRLRGGLPWWEHGQI